MRLWLMNDIHLELTRGWDLPAVADRPDFDVLVVAGDLIPRMERGVRWLADRVPDKPSILVPGNHESYGTDVDRTVEKALEAAEGTKVHVLQNRAVKIFNVAFAGATLWTDFALYGDRRRAMTIAGERMNDFKKIRKKGYAERFLPRDALARHKDSRAFIEGELRRPRGDGKLVVVSHHAPVPEPGLPATPFEAGGTVSDEKMLDAAYRSDLTALMSPQPAGDGRDALRPADLWHFGHTHQSFDAVVGGTRVVSNAKGYGPWPPKERTWENPAFDPHLVIEI
jgi:predicted phosphodiesterase